MVFFTAESSLSLTANSRMEFLVQDIQLTSGSIFPKSLEILVVGKKKSVNLRIILGLRQPLGLSKDFLKVLLTSVIS